MRPTDDEDDEDDDGQTKEVKDMIMKDDGGDDVDHDPNRFRVS